MQLQTSTCWRRYDKGRTNKVNVHEKRGFVLLVGLQVLKVIKTGLVHCSQVVCSDAFWFSWIFLCVKRNRNKGVYKLTSWFGPEQTKDGGKAQPSLSLLSRKNNDTICIKPGFHSVGKMYTTETLGYFITAPRSGFLVQIGLRFPYTLRQFGKLLLIWSLDLHFHFCSFL